MSRWARFYATVTNGRGSTTSVGGRSSVDCAHIRSAGAGVNIRTFVTTDGENQLVVSMTYGSLGNGPNTVLGTVRDMPGGPVWEAVADRMSEDAYAEGAIARLEEDDPPFDENHYLYHTPAGPNPACPNCQWRNWQQPDDYPEEKTRKDLT